MRELILLTIAISLAGCQSAYYGMAEKAGYHKREILVDRVGESRDAQAAAEEEFRSALEQLSELVEFDGGELEQMYEEMTERHESAQTAAKRVRDRIDAVENVAGALFREWENEIEEYSSERLKADSEAKLYETRRRYGGMIEALRRSESRMEPVLAALKDNVLYLKHNLNARSVASLEPEFRTIRNDIELLIRDVHEAIEKAEAFIKTME